MRITLIFGGIDGTGVWNDKDYQRTFENSHVNSLYKGWSEGPKEYLRGPTTEDWKLSALTRLQAHRIYTFVTQCWRNQGKKAVFLAGYSRGGAALIEVAKWLKADNIPVECLILFDPVDRTGQVGLPWRNTPIVDTVRHLIYAQRHPASKSRESFSNCGTKLEDPGKTKLSYEMFPNTTHGGLGGVPWTEPKNGGFINEGPPDGITNVTVAQDEIGANSIRNWAFDLVFEAIYNCKQRLESENQTSPHPDFQVPTQNNAPSLGGGKAAQRIHIVAAGDWLSKIALKYYGDPMKYDIIHKANLDVIGTNPNIIKPGQRLIIP
jgi:hypothetical protein